MSDVTFVVNGGKETITVLSLLKANLTLGYCRLQQNLADSEQIKMVFAPARHKIQQPVGAEVFETSSQQQGGPYVGINRY